ncbi:Do family serine endopeptidase [Aurantiacibacter sp. D1-12]|uniref:Do family serine endopeptidase n=1 Tax=Aurantiacibacter sp. D1-12 TaxID=2993658 RepID=UPI00237CA09E|nr:Do family serine endopeptidase [Aurantiacibacter sp. D1-12]MDE1467507.1 Do family serine endopeptidase [Aurantiacibacter sp. D1-12]
MRYSYGITSALLVSGAAISLITGVPAGAQVAQNDRLQIENAVPVQGAPNSFADLTEALQPAVVNISTRQSITVEAPRSPFRRAPANPQTRQATSLGSGFLVSADGYIVTNNHVVAPDARATLEEVTVTFPDGSEYEAELVGTDPQSDLAVLKINRADPFPFVRFGNSSQARAGDWVIAIGNPFGLSSTVTSGIISSVTRNVGTGAYDRFIQTDAAINRGNSGGPLFDMQGNVIGINNQILSASGGSNGIGLAIPAEDAAPIVQALIAGEEITRGYLGVQLQPVNDDIADALGIDEDRGELIQMIVPDEAAERAGLEVGDVVLSVNGETITPENSLSRIVAFIEPGTTVPITYIRDGERRRTNATIGRRPSDEELRQQQMFQNDGEEDTDSAPPEEASTAVRDALGIAAIEITPTIARQLGVSTDTQGLVITGVMQGSDAAQRGLGRGVMILSANGRALESLADLEDVIANARLEGRGAILLRVQARGGAARSIPVRLND